MASATVTTVPPPTYTATTIPNNTYYVGAQSFGVVIGFPSASGNLTTFNFTSGDTSQQVCPSTATAFIHEMVYTYY
jgi:hypothetical protein